MRTTALVPALVASALLLGSCAGQPAAETATTSPTSGTATIFSEGAGGDHGADDGHDHSTEHYQGPNVTWDANSERQVKDTAAKAMGLFARPGIEETIWFAELEPLLATEYKEDAKYIDPARVPITTVTDGPSISRQAQNPMTVTASFDTNDGPWEMLLHRAGQDDPWLVNSISPKAAP